MDERFKEYQKEEDHLIAGKDRIVNDFQRLLQFNLSGTRSFLLSLASFSLVILGGAVAVIDKINLYQSWPLLLIGATCLLSSVLSSRE